MHQLGGGTIAQGVLDAYPKPPDTVTVALPIARVNRLLGMEVDVECFLCGGDGCRVCKYTGWLEIAGSGMVHPTVLRNGGYDPSVWSGFRFWHGSRSASPCSSTGFRIFAISGATTCVSCSNFS